MKKIEKYLNYPFVFVGITISRIIILTRIVLSLLIPISKERIIEEDYTDF